MTSRVLGFLTGLIAALCLAAAQGWWNTRNTEVVLLSDVHGAIQEVCVHYTPAFHSESVETLDDFFYLFWGFFFTLVERFFNV